jgi:ketosteroid isomerase-like protein
MEDAMTLIEIANALVAGCREGREKENLAQLYAPDAVSVEGADMTGQGAAVTGVEAILAKHHWWESAHEMHGGTIEGPFTHGDDRFAVIFGLDVTHRETGQRIQGREVAVYHVKGGRIVREEFFYTA